MTIETKAREWAEKNWADPNDKGALNILERAYLAGAAEAVRWIPVTERLPEGRIEVLAFDMLRDSHVCIFKHGVFFDGRELIRGITHWMPLPPHPEKEQL